MSEQSPGLFTFTIDASGEVVKLETVDANGTRHELSDDEKSTLAQEGSEGLERALEAAFEAGIDCVLGNGGGEEQSAESKQDTELRQLLLVPLMKHSAAKRLLKREVLNRAILGTLIQHSMKTAPRAGATTSEGPDRAAASRAS